MVWAKGGRGFVWPAWVVRECRERDGDACQLRYPGCTGDYEELDHIVNVATTGRSRAELAHPDLVQCVCRACHKKKTAREARAGRRRMGPPPEPHPGLRW